MKKFLVVLCLMLLVFGVSNRAGALTLLDDNFNLENSGSGVLNYNGFANWDISGGTVDLIGNGYFDFLPGNGLYVDLNGSIQDPGLMKSKSAFLFNSGTQYRLSFDLAGSNTGAYPNEDVQIQVQLGALFNKTITMGGHDPFTTYTFDFTGNGNLGYLTFLNTSSPNDNIGPLLDNIKLEAVPEPATLLLVGVGLVGLAGLRRKLVK